MAAREVENREAASVGDPEVRHSFAKLPKFSQAIGSHPSSAKARRIPISDAVELVSEITDVVTHFALVVLRVVTRLVCRSRRARFSCGCIAESAEELVRNGASDEGPGNAAQEASAHHPAHPASTEGSLQSPGLSDLGSGRHSSQGLRVILTRPRGSLAGWELFAQVSQHLRSLLLGELREGFGVSLLDCIWWRRAQKVPVPL